MFKSSYALFKRKICTFSLIFGHEEIQILSKKGNL